MGKSLIPDLSSRPYAMTLEHRMKAGAGSIYNAWTRDFDLWFAEPGELIMTPEVNRPFFSIIAMIGAGMPTMGGSSGWRTAS
jgi:hypothetical protein